jgi:hypothetical protein
VINKIDNKIIKFFFLQEMMANLWDNFFVAAPFSRAIQVFISTFEMLKNKEEPTNHY